jgi:hypothetical protein
MILLSELCIAISIMFSLGTWGYLIVYLVQRNDWNDIKTRNRLLWLFSLSILFNVIWGTVYFINPELFDIQII